jgi:hypothetical protein
MKTAYAIHEVDFSWADFASQYYREALDLPRTTLPSGGNWRGWR